MQRHPHRLLRLWRHLRLRRKSKRRHHRQFKRRRVAGESFRLQRESDPRCRRRSSNRRTNSAKRCSKSCRSVCRKNTGCRPRLRQASDGPMTTGRDNGRWDPDRANPDIHLLQDSRAAAPQQVLLREPVRGHDRVSRQYQRLAPRNNGVHRCTSALIARSGTRGKRKRDSNRLTFGLSPSRSRHANFAK